MHICTYLCMYYYFKCCPLQYLNTLREGKCECLLSWPVTMVTCDHHRPLMDDRLGNPFPEDQSRAYFLQLILGLEYCKWGVTFIRTHFSSCCLLQCTIKRSSIEISSHPTYWLPMTIKLRYICTHVCT